MGRMRGFRIGRRLVRVFKWFIHRRRRGRISYKRLGSSNYATRAISKLCNLGNLLKYGAKGLNFTRPNSGYIRVGQDFMEQKEMIVPKGHLAVYVGEKEDNACRVLVPVIYFNHPLFAGLLREAEMEYGFNHSGGIQIPCRISEFEYVQSRIAATGGGGRRRGRQSWRHKYW
ncbi:auxin-responsive protein SAUR36-like [Nicotiana tomentosiformis]|uniref:auxin-responsive protein SAUR36-like n=1 Tax=Nicotiana tomentosiformis TaxID=4098 RepID=UPI00051C4E00|nr:auxin-responsive protein SAUR36-like [Nicotiana tomentosiformis]